MIDTSTPVLLLCANTPVGAIGALRSLGRLGVPVYVLDSDRGRPAYSRYCRQNFVWSLLGSSEEQSVERLLMVGTQIGRRSLLVPTFDDSAIFCATYREALSEWFLHPAQDAATIRALVSKKEMYFQAQRCGVPVPATSFPESRQEVLDFVERAQFPVALKAIRGTRLKLQTGVTAFIVQNARELLELYDRYEDPAQPNFMLQEYIPGEDSCGWGFNGYFDEQSRYLFGGTTRRLHQNPVHVGITSLATCCRNPDVEKSACDFMTAIGYRGMVNVGYRYDARDGQYKIVDVNPRLGASFRSYVAQDGMDILRACYFDLTGQAAQMPENSTARRDRKWMLELDLKSCLDYRREGRLGAREWLRSLRGIEELAYFSADDPAPFLALCMRAVRRALSRVFRRRSAPTPKPASNPELTSEPLKKAA